MPIVKYTQLRQYIYNCVNIVGQAHHFQNFPPKYIIMKTANQIREPGHVISVVSLVFSFCCLTKGAVSFVAICLIIIYLILSIRAMHHVSWWRHGIIIINTIITMEAIIYQTLHKS